MFCKLFHKKYHKFWHIYSDGEIWFICSKCNKKFFKRKTNSINYHLYMFKTSLN